MKITVKKWLLIGCGFLALALGILGILLPILPTTPFLLLSCYCFLRSSSRLYLWLTQHKVFGDYIYQYMTYKAVKKKAKIGALVFLWLSLSISFFIVNQLLVKLLLIAVGVAVSIHVLTLKTLRPSEVAPALLQNRQE